MKPIKDIEKVKTMFSQGQTALIDAKTGYKYSMTARCPKDGNYASVARIERAGQSLNKVSFQCTLCSTRFEVNQENIYVC